jgi:hypothetical protein
MPYVRTRVEPEGLSMPLSLPLAHTVVRPNSPIVHVQISDAE